MGGRGSLWVRPSFWCPCQRPLTWQLSATHTQCRQQHSQERQQQGAQHQGEQDGRLHLQESWDQAWLLAERPPGQSSSGGRAGLAGVLGPAHPARSLLRGQPHPLRGLPGSPCLTGLSGGQSRLWKTLDPRVVRPGPSLESGAPATGVDPAPRPTCPPAPRLPPQRLPACLRQEAVVSTG